MACASFRIPSFPDCRDIDILKITVIFARIELVNFEITPPYIIGTERLRALQTNRLPDSNVNDSRGSKDPPLLDRARDLLIYLYSYLFWRTIA